MKIKIDKVYYNTTNKDGDQYVNKNGEKFAIVNMIVDKNLLDDPDFDGRISYYDGDGDAVDWADGMELEGIIEKNAKGYFNFKKTTRVSSLEERVLQLEKEGQKMYEWYLEKEGIKDREPEKEEEKVDIDSPELPF